MEKDSYVVVLGNIIRELSKIRNDLYWTIISPRQIDSLDFDNTEQIILPLPSYPNAMRTHFDFKTIIREIEEKQGGHRNQPGTDQEPTRNRPGIGSWEE